MNLNDYDDIKVPESLKDYIDKGIERGINYKKESKSRILKQVASIAIISTMTLAVSNIPAFANELVKIPIVGEIVRVLDFTNSVQFGGVITDGNSMVIDSLKKDAINIYFGKYGEFIDELPNYEVNYREYPYTIVLTFNGVRNVDYTHIEDKVEKIPFVKDVYDIITLDDSQRKIAIEFKENVDFKVSEHKNPGMIQIKLKENREKINKKVSYFIRSNEFEYGEILGQKEEEFLEYNKEVQKLSNGKYIIQFGPYENKEDASKIIEKIKKDKNISTKVYLESRNIGEGPKR